MSALRPFLAGAAVAAGLAVAGWFLRVQPALDAADRRALDAADAARRARSEASDSAHWAETERGRTRELEERIAELERTVRTSLPPAPAPAGADPRTGDPPKPDAPPESWDKGRLSYEIERLSVDPAGMAKNPRFPLVVQSIRSRGDEGVHLLSSAIAARISPSMTQALCTIADALGDPRSVPVVLDVYRAETDPGVRVASLRALANLAGDEQLPDLLTAWNDKQADPKLRTMGLHGLGRRGHPIARAAAATRVDGVTPKFRIHAMEALRDCAEIQGWRDTTLVPVFTSALRSADGDPQRRLALLALEGFWSADAVPDLEAFAADSSTAADLVVRARKLVDALKAGKPRPADAGVPEK